MPFLEILDAIVIRVVCRKKCYNSGESTRLRIKKHNCNRNLQKSDCPKQKTCMQSLDNKGMLYPSISHFLQFISIFWLGFGTEFGAGGAMKQTSVKRSAFSLNQGKAFSGKELKSSGPFREPLGSENWIFLRSSPSQISAPSPLAQHLEEGPTIWNSRTWLGEGADGLLWGDFFSTHNLRKHDLKWPFLPNEACTSWFASRGPHR